MSIKWSSLIFTICGFFVCVIGALALIGQHFDKPELREWTPNHPGMAVPTAVCFVLIGTIQIILGYRMQKYDIDQAKIMRYIDCHKDDCPVKQQMGSSRRPHV